MVRIERKGKKEGVECKKRDRLFGIGWLVWTGLRRR